MKKLIIATFAGVCALSVFAQGTIVFNTFESTVRLHIYAPLATAPAFSQLGNGASDVPAGSNVWTAFSLIGASGLTGQYGGSSTMAELLAGQGQGAASLQPATAGGITTFHTGTSALGGTVVGLTSTFGNIPADYANGATVQVVAWDDSSALYPTWATASVAWMAGLIAAGESNVENLAGAIGGTGTPPYLPAGLQSFNLYFIPEPTSFALAGLGAAALLIFRRRK